MTSKKMRILLAAVALPWVFKQLTPQQQQIIRNVQHEVDIERKKPLKFVQEMTKTQDEGVQAWIKARKDSRFEDFAPILQKIVDQQRQLAGRLGYDKKNGSPYDALLDLYDPGLTTKQLDAFFGSLKAQLVPLAHAIAKAKQPDVSVIEKDYDAFDPAQQKAFDRFILEKMGFDFSRGRFETSAHPFTSDFSRDYVILTTRYNPRNIYKSIGGAIHEGGHGLYQQGIAADLSGTLQTDGASTAFHETQSRLWENPVGRSHAFWEHFFPKLQEMFPKEFANVSVDDFYRAINKVEPSPIRVEADEVTYPLHILVRYEIEKDLIEGKLKVEDIPRVWNQKMTDYIGYTPKNDAEGCLQDIHWAHGTFGYFPTYALGTVGSIQLFNQAKKELDAQHGQGYLDQQIAAGNLAPLKTWLNENLHKHGKLKKPDELYREVTGEPLNPQHFVDYLWKKYSDIYPEIKGQQPAQNE